MVASMAYHDGKLFVVDMFFITALNAKTEKLFGRVGRERSCILHLPYADGKVYVTTDRRLIYVLNAIRLERGSHFLSLVLTAGPHLSVYEGRIYIGNNDWNVYCLSNYPVTHGQISAQLDKNEVEQNETVTGCGQITPGIAYAPITVSFVKSDGTVDKLASYCTQMMEHSAFSYTPDKVGEWTVSIRCSGATYIMQSVDISLNVFDSQQTSVPEQTPPEMINQQMSEISVIPAEYIIVAVVALIVAVIAVVAYLFVKKRNKSSHVVISN